MSTDLELEHEYGYVGGLLAESKGDGPDAGRFPDFTAPNVKPRVTRKFGQYVKPLSVPRNGLGSAGITSVPFLVGVMPGGFLTSDVDTAGNVKADATPGLWLVVGEYEIDFGSFFPKIDFKVLATHTEAAPCNVFDYIGYVPPPGAQVTTVELPSVGGPGQVMAFRAGALVWEDPPAGTPGLSAYELAVAGGFVGSESEYLASLMGKDGRSAYEVAVQQGFAGTVAQWLESLKVRGDAGPAPTLSTGTTTKVASGGQPTFQLSRVGTTDEYKVNVGLVDGAPGGRTDTVLTLGAGASAGVLSLANASGVVVLELADVTVSNAANPLATVPDVTPKLRPPRTAHGWVDGPAGDLWYVSVSSAGVIKVDGAPTATILNGFVSWKVAA